MGKNIGLRVHLAERLDDLLPAAHTDEPIVNDGNSHPQCLEWRSTHIASQILLPLRSNQAKRVEGINHVLLTSRFAPRRGRKWYPSNSKSRGGTVNLPRSLVRGFW